MDKTDAKAAMEELTMILIYLSDLQNRFANKDDGKDYIRQGSHRSKSLYITKEGEEKAKELLEKYNVADRKALHMFEVK